MKSLLSAWILPLICRAVDSTTSLRQLLLPANSRTRTRRAQNQTEKKSSIFAELHLLFGKPGTPCLVPAGRCRTPSPWMSSAPRAPCWCRRSTPCQAGGAPAGTPAGSPWKHIPLSHTKDLGMERTMAKAGLGTGVKWFLCKKQLLVCYNWLNESMKRENGKHCFKRIKGLDITSPSDCPKLHSRSGRATISALEYLNPAPVLAPFRLCHVLKTKHFQSKNSLRSPTKGKHFLNYFFFNFQSVMPFCITLCSIISFSRSESTHFKFVGCKFS